MRRYCLGQFAAIGAASEFLAVWGAAHRGDPGPAGELARGLDGGRDLRTALASLGVGVLCTTVSHPDDVVKTRQQTRLPGAAAATGGREPSPERRIPPAGATLPSLYTPSRSVAFIFNSPSFSLTPLSPRPPRSPDLI